MVGPINLIENGGSVSVTSQRPPKFSIRLLTFGLTAEIQTLCWKPTPEQWEIGAMIHQRKLVAEIQAASIREMQQWRDRQ